MYKYLTLENISEEILYNVFLDAFQGFQIVTEATFDDFCEMLKNNKYDPMISVGAFIANTNEMVGFVLNCIKNIENKITAYAILTGTKTMFQKQGIMKNIFNQVKQIIINKNILLYKTEVLVNNIPAIKFYQSQGFKIKNEIKTIVSTKAISKEVIQYELLLEL